MRSATSFFNGTLYRKTMARFWPLWALYGIVWMFAMPLNLLNDCLQGFPSRYTLETGVYSQASSLLYEARTIPYMLSFGLGLAVFFGVLSAMAVFSYLYNIRSACSMHGLPLRREALFTTNYLAGLSFMLLPNLVSALLTAAVELAFLPSNFWGEGLWPLLVWLLCQSALCLFFYSFAVFCAMFTGHILALPAFYGILNGLAYGLLFLVTGLMQEFLFGYTNNYSSAISSLVEYLTPVVTLQHAIYWDWVWVGANQVYHLSSALTVLGYAIAAVVLTLLALYVYKRRHVETAGDVVSVALVRPVFKYGVSFCAGLAFGTFTAAFFSIDNEVPQLIFFILLWTVVGYFVAEMFLKKTFRVFKAWKGAVAMTVVMAVLCAGCAFDLFGYERRVPRADEVASMAFTGLGSAPYDSGSGNSNRTSDPDEIAAYIALHQAIVNAHEEYGGDYDDMTFANITYTLKNGSTLSRRYSVFFREEDMDTPGTVTWAANQIVQNRNIVARDYDFDFYEQDRLAAVYLNGAYDPEQAQTVSNHYLDFTQTELLELWQAVRADFDDGSLGVRYLLTNSDERYANTYRTDLCFEWDISTLYADDNADQSGSSTVTKPAFATCTVTLTPTAGRTLDWLEKHGVFNETCQLLER